MVCNGGKEMKSQILLLFILMYLAGCAKSQISKEELVDYPWIPNKVNWNEGSFETLYFYNDSNFVKIGSTQVLSNDSITFLSEPGFILYNGTYTIEKNDILLTYRIVYRTFTRVGEKVPGEFINEKIFVSEDKPLQLKFKGKSFIKVKNATSEGLQRMRDIINKFLPTLTK